jgi:hypothetical protein
VCGGARQLPTILLLFMQTVPAGGQSIISTRSGLVHYFEGVVYLDHHPLEAHLGKFSNVPQGAELRTEQGRAEVLLTPGVFLRMGERSAIRMVANDLADTQVELERGSVIVETGEPNQETAVTLIYRNWKVHFPQKGLYRIDSDPPSLRVLQGAAEVVTTPSGELITVEKGTHLPFASVLVPERSSHQPADALSEWDKSRAESIIADNIITAEISLDPAPQTLDLHSFAYAYLRSLGVPSLGLVSSRQHDSIIWSEPGLMPLWLGRTMGRGFRSYVLSRLPRIGVSPRTGTTPSSPRPAVPRPATIHPVRGGTHR